MRVQTAETTLASTSVVAAATDQISCDLGGEEVILDLRSGVYYGLDVVGARIWRLVQQPLSVSDITDVVMSEFEVGQEECESDLRDFLATMIQHGLVGICN
jgi:hypothetical protein